MKSHKLIENLVWFLILTSVIFINISSEVIFPIVILRMFSLSLVVVFGYYLYRREQEVSLKTIKINQKLDNTLQELEKKTKALSRVNEKLKRLDQNL